MGIYNFSSFKAGACPIAKSRRWGSSDQSHSSCLSQRHRSGPETALIWKRTSGCTLHASGDRAGNQLKRWKGHFVHPTLCIRIFGDGTWMSEFSLMSKRCWCQYESHKSPWMGAQSGKITCPNLLCTLVLYPDWFLSPIKLHAQLWISFCSWLWFGISL